MKKQFIFFLLVLAVLSAYAQAEITGIWVHGYGAGYLTKQDAKEMVDFCHVNHINSIFVQARKLGDAHYVSKMEPAASSMRTGYDPLKFLVDYGHKQNPPVSIHAWLVMNKVASKAQENKLNKKHVLSRHPEWKMLNEDGSHYFGEGGKTIWVDPGIPAVHHYYCGVVSEILAKYDVDGIHLDYIRYPAKNAGYAPMAVDYFNQQNNRSGKPAASDIVWADWRRTMNTRLVDSIHKTIQKKKPQVMLSVAASCNYKYHGDPSDSAQFSKTEPYGHFFQNWPEWAENRTVDLICLMNYKRENEKWASEYRKWCDFSNNLDSQSLIVVGQGTYLNKDPKANLKQLAYAKKIGLDGFVIYNYTAQHAKKKDPLYAMVRDQLYPGRTEFTLPEWLKKGQNEISAVQKTPVSAPKSVAKVDKKPLSVVSLEEMMAKKVEKPADQKIVELKKETVPVEKNETKVAKPAVMTTIVLNNGNAIKGTIAREDDQNVHVNVNGGKMMMTLPKAMIKEMR